MRKLLVLLLLLSFTMQAQRNVQNRYASFNLNEVALLNIEPSNSTVILNLETPNFPGEKAEITSINNSKWINFTSAISNKSSSRSLSVKIDDGSIPKGLTLKLAVDSYSGIGKGALGRSNETITLSKNNQTIVSNIGGAYTGFGENNGYKITYLLDIYDYKLLNMGDSETLTISYTLTDF